MDTGGPGRQLESLTFDNTFARLPEGFAVRVDPTPCSDPPRLIHVNPQALALLDLDPREATRPEFAGVFGGSLLVPGMEPLAMLYAGHQFGIYVPQLGDGRAILLGEVRNRAGDKWDLQLKGAGRTPFSRDGDGRAVLRSTIREYLCSEAMYGLRIPTTRALSVVGSSDKVYRERVETAAVLCRLAPSHVRFGSFEVLYHRGQHERLRLLADYVIEHNYPECREAPDRYARWFRIVVERTARLIAHWQAVGWAHGVMNTDNMSIIGLTLDYGPFGFLDDYDPGFICNHSDFNGRYAFDRQPDIGHWNLRCLAQALTPLVEREVLQDALTNYVGWYRETYFTLMRKKIGLVTVEGGDEELIADWLALLQENSADYTNTFRALASFSTTTGATNEMLRDLFVNRAGFDAWAVRYKDRLLKESVGDAERPAGMEAANPRYVLRNYLAQQAIEHAERGDYTEIDRLLTILHDPYRDHPGMERYAAAPPNWGKHLNISCSS